MTERVNAIRVLAGALDESEIRGGTIILRGVIDSDSLKHLRVDDYQREALPLTSLRNIIVAVRNGDALPDIEIGMRGARVSTRSDVYTLNDSCFIIDGQQRTNACLAVLAQNPDAQVRLGATIHFNTTREWERERFRILNSLRSKVSPNVLLRNMREDNPALASLYGLCTNDKTFPLHNRVSWSQSMKRGDLTSALTIVKIAGLLHSHRAAGRSNSMSEIVRSIGQAGEIIGNGNMRANLKLFFEVVDECFGIKLVQYREMAPYMRGAFLMTLARLMSDHYDFWPGEDERKLAVDVNFRRKLKTFPLSDPQVAGLCAATGRGAALLYGLIRDHINRGKRTGHLRPRRAIEVIDDDAVAEDIAA